MQVFVTWHEESGKFYIDYENYVPSTLDSALQAKGKIVEMPLFESQAGKYIRKVINPDTYKIVSEYYDIPPTPEQIIKQKIQQLEQDRINSQLAMAELIEMLEQKGVL